jgi:phage FluMu protein Com
MSTEKVVSFTCKKCSEEYTVLKGVFQGFYNWECPRCRALNPPKGYTGYGIKGCENTTF